MKKPFIASKTIHLNGYEVDVQVRVTPAGVATWEEPADPEEIEVLDYVCESYDAPEDRQEEPDIDEVQNYFDRYVTFEHGY